MLSWIQQRHMREERAIRLDLTERSPLAVVSIAYTLAADATVFTVANDTGRAQTIHSPCHMTDLIRLVTVPVRDFR
jgi:hypothetical protein